MAKPLELRVDSTVYVNAAVTVDHDITGAPISVALPSANVVPAPGDFVAASVTGTVASGGEWTSTYRLLVGPAGALVPAVGLRDWTVKITSAPEIPIFKAGQVRVTAT